MKPIIQKITHASRFLFAIIFLSFLQNSKAQPLLSFQKFDDNFTKPVDIKFSGDDPGKLFIVQQTGQIIIEDLVTKNRTIFLDISAKIKLSGQKGLLGLAFHPDYKNNDQFFIYYNELVTSNITVEAFKRKANNHAQADLTTGHVLLSEEKPHSGGIHNGGCMHFGSDGYLYIGLGDGSPKGDPYNIAQNGTSLFGKILRIDVNETVAPYYKIPPDNPFLNDPTIRDEVWALGLRNPWRFSFDRLTHDIWIGDVGQKYFEEIDFATPAQSALGLNYGWRCFEGNTDYKTSGCQAKSYYTSPVLVYDHLVAPSRKADGSVIGGCVYRGNSYPDLQGWYICGDYMLGVTFLIKPDGQGNWNTTMQSDVPKFTTFGESEDAEMFGADYEGNIYQVTTIPQPPAAKTSSEKKITDKAIVYPTIATNHITIEMKEPFQLLRLIDMNGNAVLTQKLFTTAINTLQLTLPDLSTGAYIVELSGKTKELHKIIIQK